MCYFYELIRLCFCGQRSNPRYGSRREYRENNSQHAALQHNSAQSSRELDPLFYITPGDPRPMSQLTESEIMEVALRMDVIANLPCATFEEPKREKHSECIVCMCEYAVGENLRYLPCLHAFHRTCIDDWLMRSLSCPSCLQAIKPQSIYAYGKKQPSSRKKNSNHQTSMSEEVESNNSQRADSRRSSAHPHRSKSQNQRFATETNSSARSSTGKQRKRRSHQQQHRGCSARFQYIPPPTQAESRNDPNSFQNTSNTAATATPGEETRNAQVRERPLIHTAPDRNHTRQEKDGWRPTTKRRATYVGDINHRSGSSSKPGLGNNCPSSRSISVRVSVGCTSAKPEKRQKTPSHKQQQQQQYQQQNNAKIPQQQQQHRVSKNQQHRKREVKEANSSTDTLPSATTSVESSYSVDEPTKKEESLAPLLIYCEPKDALDCIGPASNCTAMTLRAEHEAD
ncbi:hypothetical protein Ciccas_003791 [Cichlidogyrus casuarinus]|uniref:RING-type domain-containing protein n=1 Tax=Cichlidogyrus casuarinus TaxID=1844966 RepID=A0ABD2QDD5_9PLAT